MKKKTKILVSLVYFTTLFLLFLNICEAKPRFITHHGKLSLENEPAIGQITLIRLLKTGGYDDSDAELGCFFSEGLELINDKGYKVTYVEPPLSLEKGLKVIFYSGPFKKGETKEAIFKVRILDGKKYTIAAGGPYDPEGELELDLGDPEPPELPTSSKQYVGIKEGKQYIKSDIKQLAASNLTDLTIPEDSLPPLRTELAIRTKDRPHYDYYHEIVSNRQPDKDTSIPFRYLVYTEEETPNLKAQVIIPAGLEFINEESLSVSTLPDGRKKILLYSAPMRFKQSRAFYFKVRAISREEELPIEAISELTTTDGKTLLKVDRVVINLKPRRRL